MAKSEKELEREFAERDAMWENHIKNIVNNGIDPREDKKFKWDECAIWYYKSLMRDKKRIEQDMIKRYGKILYPVAFAPTESDT